MDYRTKRELPPEMLTPLTTLEEADRIVAQQSRLIDLSDDVYSEAEGIPAADVVTTFKFLNTLRHEFVKNHDNAGDLHVSWVLRVVRDIAEKSNQRETEHAESGSRPPAGEPQTDTGGPAPSGDTGDGGADPGTRG